MLRIFSQRVLVTANLYSEFPNLAVEVGVSQKYERYGTGTALMDRVDMLLLGTASHTGIQAVIIVNIDEDKSETEAERRFSGFVELWRRGSANTVVRDGPRQDLWTGTALQLRQRDVYGDAPEAPECPPERQIFELKLRWLRRSLKAHLPQHIRNVESSRAQRRRKAEGDLGRNFAPIERAF